MCEFSQILSFWDVVRLTSKLLTLWNFYSETSFELKFVNLNTTQQQIWEKWAEIAKFLKIIVILEWKKTRCTCPMNVQYEKYNTEYRMSTCLKKFEVSKSIVATI